MWHDTTNHFRQSRALLANLNTVHILTVHENQKNYKCEFCDKSFARKEHLTKHIYTIHEGRKDHKCDFCQKLFSSDGNKKQHVNKIHVQ